MTGPQVGKHWPGDSKLHVFYRNRNDDKLIEGKMDEKGN